MAISPFEREWSALQKLAAGTATDLQEIASTLARIFRVRWHEVALLRVRGRHLEFVLPRELSTAGAIPLSSSAIAARTATGQESALFNDFTKVLHHSMFEVVPLGAPKPDFNPDRIHKLMSAAVVNADGQTTGVVQISRKGATRDVAGPDFTESDLRQLEIATQCLAPLLAALSAK